MRLPGSFYRSSPAVSRRVWSFIFYTESRAVSSATAARQSFLSIKFNGKELISKVVKETSRKSSVIISINE